MKEERGSFLYFAYGSNMLTARLKKRTPSASVVATGRVAGRRLAFDKVSGDGSGKCDMEKLAEPTSHVLGVLFRISEQERRALDKAEGCGAGYEAEWVTVGTTSKEEEALTYIASKKNPDLRPYSWYKAYVIAGAREHGLPKEYVDQIELVPSTMDPEPERRMREEAFLAAATES